MRQKRLFIDRSGHRLVVWLLALFPFFPNLSAAERPPVGEEAPFALERVQGSPDLYPVHLGVYFSELSVSLDGGWLRVQLRGFQKYYFFSLEDQRFEWQSPGPSNYSYIHRRWSKTRLILQRRPSDEKTVFFLAGLNGKRPTYLFAVHEDAFGVLTSGGRFLMTVNSRADPQGFRYFDLDQRVLGQRHEPLPPRTWLQAFLPLPGDGGFAVPCGQSYLVTTGVLLARAGSGGRFEYLDFHQAFSDALKREGLDTGRWKTEVRLYNSTACMRDQSTLRFLTVSRPRNP